jgi:hypothetical protein
MYPEQARFSDGAGVPDPKIVIFMTLLPLLASD